MPQAGDKLYAFLAQKFVYCYVCALCSFWIVCSDLFCGQDVAKPMGLFAFVLCMCCMALWSLRKTSLRKKTLQQIELVHVHLASGALRVWNGVVFCCMCVGCACLQSL